MPEKTEPHYCSEENAARFAEWLEKRGGIAVWKSANLSNPGASWSSPALTPDGQPTTRPTWQANSTPARIITSADDVVVETMREYKRFRVALRMGAQGFSIKCTDASSARIHKWCERAAEQYGYSSYVFDYETQECVILVPASQVKLTDWLAQRAAQPGQTQ